MHKTLLLLALIGASLAAVGFSDVKTTANTESEQSLGGGALTGFDSKLKTALPSVKVKTTNDATISLSITNLDLTTIIGGLLGGVSASFAGGVAPDSASLFVDFNTGVFDNTLSSLKQGISLTVTSSVDTTVTLRINTGSFAVSGEGINAQTGLFLGTNDASVSGSATVYGAVPYTISADNKEYTYTFPVKKGDTKLYLKPFDLNKTKNGNNVSGSQSNGGSSSFNFNAAFLPVAYNTKFNLQSGYQYAFGNNIRVTPSGSNAGDLTVQNEGAFSTSAAKSAGPAGASAYLDGSFHFSSTNNAQNIIQYVAKKSDQTRFFVNGTVSGSVDTIGTAKGKTLTWYRATGDAGAAVAANAWSKVSSTSNYDANGNLVVYAQVSSYSHWTVGSSDGAAAGLQVTIATVLLATLLALAL